MANFNLDSNMVFGTNLFSQETLFNVQTVNLPGITLGAIKVPSRHDTLTGTISSSQMEYSPLVMTVICDEEMNVWKELIGNLMTHKDYDGLDSDGWLTITDNTNKTVLKLTFHNVVPISVSDMEYSTTNSNDQLVFEFEVHYDYYSVEGVGSMQTGV